MARCYIAGPMRGIPQYNYPAFMAAASVLKHLGHEVFNPADMDSIDEEDWESIPVEKHETVSNAALARRFARRDLSAILSLRAEDGDFLCVLPGWEKSTGAQAEVKVAKWIYLPIRTLGELQAERSDQ